jgi:protocatechuate 3,4-dioxygenase alpha subunit
MPQNLPYLHETASQTAGPYVHIGLAPGAAGFEIFRRELGWDIAGPDAPGERIRIEGVVFDGTGSPVKDVLLEAWQADANGVHAHPEDPRHHEAATGFRGWGRVITDFDTGLWSFETVKPGRVMGRNARPQAPHISLWIVARGINIGLSTRLYFDDEAEANAADPVLNLVEQAGRRETLLARRGLRDGKPVYRFDIRLQGDGETVFFDV